MKIKTVSCAAIVLTMAVLTGGCNNDSASSAAPSTTHTYSTTSSKGDYSEWTLSGNALDATWNVISTDGDIDYTYTVSASCGNEDSYGVRSCTTISSQCVDVAAVCAGSFPASFELMAVPGVAIFVQTGSGSDAQLHVGFAKDSSACTQDVSGDYTMMFAGLGLQENYGVYRSDANFVNVMHADFGFSSPDGNTVQQDVVYTTGTESEVFVDGGCVDGIRTRSSGTDTLRSMLTASGLFVVDLPAGQGGLISFRTDKAASLADLASKSFGGIVFPDNAGPELLRADFGAVSGSQVNITAVIGSDTENLSIKTLATASTASSPAYPDFTVSPALDTVYASSALSVDYPTPAAIPGLFKLDGLSDTGRVIIAAMKFNDKVIGIGMVYNYRTTADINPGTNAAFTADGLYNTGNFLLFER